MKFTALLAMALKRDTNNRYEFIKPGQKLGDDGNFSVIIVGTEFKLEVRVSGAWKTAFAFPTP